MHLLIPVLLFSCGAFKGVTPEEQEKGVKPTVKIHEESGVRKVYFKGEEYRVPPHKKEFNLALILPFHTGTKDYEAKLRSDYMLEYYQGIQVAIKQMESLESKFTIHVYDSRNDIFVLKQILGKPELKKMDIIIGPTDKEQVLIAANFAETHKILLFSPITVIDDPTYANPYLFNFTASERVKALEFIRFYEKFHPEKQLIIVRDGKRFDRGFCEALLHELASRKHIHFKVLKYSPSLNWSEELSGDHNMVLLSAEDKNTVNYVVTGLVPFSDQVTLTGSEKWLKFTSVDYSFWSKLKIHFLSEGLAEIENTQSLLMKKHYREAFHGDPGRFTYMGYDQMLFVAELLNAFGTSFPLFIDQKTFEYANNRFSISPDRCCHQNRTLNILLFEKNELSNIGNY